MKLGELKRSLGRFPPDMDDLEVIIQYISNGKPDVDLLMYVAYGNLREEHYAMFLGTWKQVDHMIQEGKLDRPENYIEPPSSE